MPQSFDIKVETNLNADAARQMRELISQATSDVFVHDIWPEAVSTSPYKTGHNARTVTVEIEGEGVREVLSSEGDQAGIADGAEGTVVARLYTQSGYGGYLEVGHTVKATTKAWRYLGARPYLYPAFMKYVNRITAQVQAKVEGFKGTRQ